MTYNSKFPNLASFWSTFNLTCQCKRSFKWIFGEHESCRSLSPLFQKVLIHVHMMNGWEVMVIWSQSVHGNSKWHNFWYNAPNWFILLAKCFSCSRHLKMSHCHAWERLVCSLFHTCANWRKIFNIHFWLEMQANKSSNHDHWMFLSELEA